MIILHFKGNGKHMMAGVREYIKLYYNQEDLECAALEDHETEAEFLEACTAPGFTLVKKYDTGTDDLTGLPFDRMLELRE